MRDHGDLEVPAAGIWRLLPSSSVTVGGRVLAVSQGWMDLAEDPTECWLRVDLHELLLETTTARISADPYEASAWSFSGTADGTEGRLPMHLDLRYRGVFRRGERTWSWFTGHGGVGEDVTRESLRRMPLLSRLRPAPERLTLTLDLLFDAPR